MKILAIDTALDACQAAVFDSGAAKLLAMLSHDMRRGHAEALIPIIADTMKAAGLDYPELDRIATTVGPGSYTGLRVCISAARGIAMAASKPAVGITTLAALSAPLIEEDPAVPVVAAIDARHGNVFFHMAGAGHRVLLSARHTPLEEAILTVAAGPVRLVGPGAALLASKWPRHTGPAPVSVDVRTKPSIEWVARLAAATEPTRSPAKPLYLRAPDVTPQTSHHIARQ
ncbi:MAG: tRNA (adenosine(37)-N6)-threonylcarbamoyltransferase complex dimerization subunit type 1 TsaB [Xanthobacteraceae bacterium]|jgi:tRNA threonylcarbamoyl adenosine modification protein YeaZ|nr:tRNA (adenosine(37)-N6)-threonylcarbamoyltransferase complex dimerization subunit type 1 TsaB [Xanthobacteraceae bacterium]